jgi:hypothetical protein
MDPDYLCQWTLADREKREKGGGVHLCDTRKHTILIQLSNSIRESSRTSTLDVFCKPRFFDKTEEKSFFFNTLHSVYSQPDETMIRIDLDLILHDVKYFLDWKVRTEREINSGSLDDLPLK